MRNTLATNRDGEEHVCNAIASDERDYMSVLTFCKLLRIFMRQQSVAVHPE
jgi:hypothetical protein